MSQSTSQEYQNLSSTMLKIAAAGVWNRESAWFGIDEPIERTVAKTRIASEFTKFSRIATLPGSLRMGPQENPAAYLGSKFAYEGMSANVSGEFKAVFDLLKKLHEARIDPEKDPEKLTDPHQLQKLDALGDKVARLVNVKESTAEMLLPVLVESTREALDRPRGPRQSGSDRPSRPLSGPEKTELRRAIEKWR
jgi:hypothetical protein